MKIQATRERPSERLPSSSASLNQRRQLSYREGTAAVNSALAHNFGRIALYAAPPRVKGRAASAQRPAISCDIAGSSPPPPILVLHFDNGAADLSSTQIRQIDDFVTSWDSAGGATNVRVDGYASKLGKEEVNWRLSCARALNIAAALNAPKGGTVPGVPQGQLSFFAHGETDEFSASEEAPNRVAMITMGSLSTPATTEQALLIQNKSGGPIALDCGGYDWQTAWLLAMNSEAGGHIVQHVVVDYDIKNVFGWDVTALYVKKKHWSFWEAWSINAGEGATAPVSSVAPTTPVKGGTPTPDFSVPPSPYVAGYDQFADPETPGTKGRIVVSGDAQFYEGLATLPPDFVPQNTETQAQTLPSTTADPKFTGGTANVDHDLTVEWDCTLSSGKTKIVSHTP